MDSEQVKRYGIKEQSVALDEADRARQELDVRGYTVVESGFSDYDLDDLRERLDKAVLQQQSEFGGYAELNKVGEGDTLRAPLLWDERFLAVAINPRVVEICRRVLGDYFIINQQNGIRNPPMSGSHSQGHYHRDLPYQHFVSSRPLALNALLCLDSFTPENGGTRVIPGSHKIEYFPDDGVVKALEVAISVPRGCYLVLNSMVFHSAGTNTTTEYRRGINTVFTIPIIKQQIALPPSLQGRFDGEPALKRLLGFEVDSPKSLLEWFDSRRRQ